MNVMTYFKDVLQHIFAQSPVEMTHISELGKTDHGEGLMVPVD